MPIPSEDKLSVNNNTDHLDEIARNTILDISSERIWPPIGLGTAEKIWPPLVKK